MPSPATGKPTVFVSSTIGDFADIRGALKFWLEESGYEVWLSEHTDFVMAPDANTFEACFDSVRSADFYILLIGERRGSLYSEAHEVSVTQQEYRVAYQAFSTEGHPIPILFARARVMDLLRGWRSAGGTGQPPFPDAAFIESLITEVAREHETDEAVKGLGPYPLANWVHRFGDFRDVVDALRIALSLRINLAHQRILGAMQLDLEVSLRSLVEKVQFRPKGTPIEAQMRAVVTALPESDRQGADAKLTEALDDLELDLPRPHHWLLQDVVKEVPLSTDSQEPITLNARQRRRLAMYLGGGVVNPERIWLDSLRSATTSGALLRYDPGTRSLEDTELNVATVELLEEAGLHEQRHETAQPAVQRLLGLLSVANRAKLQNFSLRWEDAVVIWGLHFSQVNLFRRMASLYAYLRGFKATPTPESLVQSSPFGSDEDAAIAREQLARADIHKWFATSSFWKA